MAEFIEAVASWPTLLTVLLVFGFAPTFVLRVVVGLYPKDDPRRAELVAELYVVPRVERPLWVAEQIAVVLFEGLPLRWRARRLDRRAVICRLCIPSLIASGLFAAAWGFLVPKTTRWYYVAADGQLVDPAGGRFVGTYPPDPSSLPPGIGFINGAYLDGTTAEIAATAYVAWVIAACAVVALGWVVRMWRRPA